MELSVPHRPTSALVFDSPSRRRHHHHRRGHNYYYRSDSDTDDSTLFPSSYDSSDTDDTDDSTYYRCHVPLPRRSRTSRRWRWPRGGVLAYPGCAPWVPGVTGGGAVVGGLVQGPAQLVGAAAASQAQMLQLQAQALQAQAQAQAQAQQQQPRRYGYRRFHYQGGERVQTGHGHGHRHHRHHHHHRRANSPRRCILPRFGRWLIGDPPERGRRSRGCCDDGSECCGDGCGAGTTAGTTTITPTVHHEDEYWGPGVRRDRPLLYPL